MQFAEYISRLTILVILMRRENYPTKFFLMTYSNKIFAFQILQIMHLSVMKL